MATIHMEPESCRAVATQLGTARDALNDQIASLQATVNNTVGSAWIAPSATQFQSTYQEWASAMKSLTEQLTDLQTRLNAEVAEFEQAAANLG